MSSHLVKTVTTVSGILLIALVFSGCGSKPAATPAPAPETSGTPAPQQDHSPAVANSTSPATSPSTPANPGGKETKWIGKIPYDVFYDQPLSIAADTTVIGQPKSVVESSPSIASATPMTSPPAMSSAPGATSQANPAPAPTGSTNWSEIIPLPTLVEEVKNLRARLTGNLNTVATFNKSSKAISLDAATLAALAAVAEVHPEAVSWKANAKYVRDLAAEISGSAEGTGREPFNKSKEPFEKLTTILDGGQPPEIDSKDRVPFGETVYVADMMKRIELSFNGVKSNVNTAAKLKDEAANTERELRILEMFGAMMLDPSYDSSQEEKYKALTARFTGGAVEALSAIKTGDFDGYHAALNKMQTTCAECHAEYRGNGNAF